MNELFLVVIYVPMFFFSYFTTYLRRNCEAYMKIPTPCPIITTERRTKPTLKFG